MGVQSIVTLKRVQENVYAAWGPSMVYEAWLPCDVCLVVDL